MLLYIGTMYLLVAKGFSRASSGGGGGGGGGEEDLQLLNNMKDVCSRYSPSFCQLQCFHIQERH